MPDTTGFLDGLDMDIEEAKEYMNEVSEDTEVEEEETYSDDGVTDATEDTEEEVVEETPTIEETIDYSYNHRTTPIPKASVEAIGKALGYSPEEVVTILQKGSNYDTLSSRQQPYEGLIEQIRGYAADNGMELADAVTKMQDALNVVSAGKYVNQIKAKYPNAPAQMVQEMAIQQAREANRQASVNRQTKLENESKATEERMWTSFFANHPDARPETLSPRMLQALENHEDPERVYMAERYEALQKELNDLKQKSSNSSRSTGSAKTTSGRTEQNDSFLDGFLGG
jgi:hypothetical protein